MLNTYNHHFTKTHFIFSLFGFMSWSRSIYAVSLWPNFHFQPHFQCHYSYNVIKTDTLVFVQNISYYFWVITWIKKVNNFQIVNVQPQGVVSFCLIFCKLQPGVAYKIVAYKKKACVPIWQWTDTHTGLKWIDKYSETLSLINIDVM